MTPKPKPSPREKFEEFVTGTLRHEKFKKAKVETVGEKAKKKYVRIVADGKTYVGITKDLKKIFYPKAKKSGHGGDFVHGKATGIRVHDELNQLSRRGNVTNMHRLTRAMYQYVTKTLGLTILWGEYPCYNTDRKATIIDAIAWNHALGKPCLIEWKTGSPERYTVGVHTMSNLPKSTNEKIPVPQDSVKNTHSLQVLITREILRRGFKINVPVDQCYVVHGYEKNDECVVQHHTPCVFMKKHANEIYNTFVKKSHPFK